MTYRLRTASAADKPALEALIARSARGLGAPDYTPAQIEGALRGAFGVDSQLVADGTYFVVEDDGAIAGCGGWSRRRTLFGGDTHVQRDAGTLDPTVDAAKIRAFFVDPAHARKGAGRLLLDHCEAEARAVGFARFELMATLPGRKLYEVCGYVAAAPVQHELAPGLAITFVPMRKDAPAVGPG